MSSCVIKVQIQLHGGGNEVGNISKCNFNDGKCSVSLQESILHSLRFIETWPAACKKFQQSQLGHRCS